MTKKIFNIIAVAVALIVTNGCTSPIKVCEILQLPETAQLYTAHNIWFQNSDEISSMNYQQGSLLPFGTKVEIVAAYDDEVTFKTLSNGREFTIEYDPIWMMMPIEKYLKQIFTDKSADSLTKNIPSSSVQNIKDGIVKKGMTREEVIIAWGAPVIHRTPSRQGNTWVFWKSEFVTKRVVFKKNKVIRILTIE